MSVDVNCTIRWCLYLFFVHLTQNTPNARQSHATPEEDGLCGLQTFSVPPNWIRIEYTKCIVRVTTEILPRVFWNLRGPEGSGHLLSGGNWSQCRLMGQKSGQRERKGEDSQSYSEHQTKHKGRTSGKNDEARRVNILWIVWNTIMLII